MLNGLYNIRIRKIYLIRMHITLHRSGSVLLSYNRIHFRGKAPPPLSIDLDTGCAPGPPLLVGLPPSLYLSLAVPLRFECFQFSQCGVWSVSGLQ